MRCNLYRWKSASGCFSNVVDLLKVMSLTPHACYELKSLNYKAITIEFVNYLPTKFNGDMFFELPPIHWDKPNNCKVWIENLIVMLGASCRLVTLRICLD